MSFELIERVKITSMEKNSWKLLGKINKYLWYQNKSIKKRVLIYEEGLSVLYV